MIPTKPMRSFRCWNTGAPLGAVPWLGWIRNFGRNAHIDQMNKTPLPEQIAKLERKRLAAEDGAKAIQEAAERSIAVRENMARLRALRLAKAREIAEDRAGSINPKKRSRYSILKVRAF
jgi:hypothetical protein